MTSRTRTEITAEVDEMATELLEVDPEMSWEEAQALIWEAFPALYDEHVSAPIESPAFMVEKSAPRPETVGEVIMKAIKHQAGLRAWTAWPSKSIGDLEFDTWDSPEGRQLYELHRAVGQQPYEEARRSLAKSFEWVDAWTILDAWLP
jgi:hypothetical protein